MSKRHQAEKAALLRRKEVWDIEHEYAMKRTIAMREARQKRIQAHNAQQNQVIQKQNRLGKENIKSVLCPRKTGWSIFVAHEDIKKAKELIGGKVVENQL